MREIREEAATRLARELDRAVELLAREELARRVEAEPRERTDPLVKSAASNR